MPPSPNTLRLSLLAAATALSLLACTSTEPTPTPEVTATATASASPTATPPPTPTPPPASATPTTTPPPIELISGWPSGAIGPLVLYEHNVEGTAEVVVFDLGAGRSLNAIRFPDRQPGDIALGGASLFENRHDSLWIYQLDGTARELFRPLPGGYIERVVPSPDGSLVALNQGDHSASNLIEVIDVERGEVILTASQEAATAAGFIGVAGPDYWSQDQQRIALVGYIYSESHGGRGSLALDGTIELTEPRGAPFLGIDPIGIDPVGERPTVVYQDQSFICAFSGYGGARRLVLVDSETGSELNSVEARWHSLSTGVWSPDGTEYRYTHRDLSDEIGEAIEAAAAEGPCAGYELLTQAWSAPRTWNLLSIDGSPPVVYNTLLEIQQRWYGDRTVTFVCGDQVAPGTSRHGWSNPRFEGQDCYRDPIEIRVGDQPIGSARYPGLLGFIERPAAVVSPQDTAWRLLYSRE